MPKGKGMPEHWHVQVLAPDGGMAEYVYRERPHAEACRQDTKYRGLMDDTSFTPEDADKLEIRACRERCFDPTEAPG